MKIRGISACLVVALLLPACRKPKEVTVDESRSITMRDENIKLAASSKERFETPAAPAAPDSPGAPAAGPSPIMAGMLPEGWTELPGNQFRLLNYKFGTGGEVAVGISVGGMADNVNRWLRQFDKDPLSDAAIAKLEQGTVLGIPGLWVEAEGDYMPGMGQSARPGQGLYGIVAEKNGRIFTVKMTGPAAEVAAQKEKLKAYVAALAERGQ